MNRRELLAAGGAALLAGGGAYALLRDGGEQAATTTPQTGAKASSCVLAPEQTEGPYYLDGAKDRRDITDGRPGTPLELRLTVQQADSCEPISGATVELWHCDAGGAYSGVEGDSSEMFCRGGQKTGSDGVATIETIYPGWYQGRAPHIHVKVHVSGSEVHTGQLYFDEAVSERVYKQGEYASRGPAETTNSSDGIYAQGGEQSTVKLTRAGEGYVGRLAMGVRA